MERGCKALTFDPPTRIVAKYWLDKISESSYFKFLQDW